MALHCAATLFLVTSTGPADPLAAAGGPGALAVAPLAADADVVAELQALADLHRGERVVVPVTDTQRAAVVEHLGRAPRPGSEPLVLEVGDDGWLLAPSGR